LTLNHDRQESDQDKFARMIWSWQTQSLAACFTSFAEDVKLADQERREAYDCRAD
jgi:hypothetical protein